MNLKNRRICGLYSAPGKAALGRLNTVYRPLNRVLRMHLLHLYPDSFSSRFSTSNKHLIFYRSYWRIV
jgi:hypothetical protein